MLGIFKGLIHKILSKQYLQNRLIEDFTNNISPSCSQKIHRPAGMNFFLRTKGFPPCFQKKLLKIANTQF